MDNHDQMLSEWYGKDYEEPRGYIGVDVGEGDDKTVITIVSSDGQIVHVE